MYRVSLVLGLSLLAGCALSFIQDPRRVEIQRDLVYAEVDGKPLEIDIYMPSDREASKRPPLVIWMHGGSWMFGTHHDCRIDWLAEEGFAVASIAYRTSLEAKWPAQIHDTKAAIRWLRENEDRFGYDSSRIAAAGMSSGGHLALMLGMTNGEGDYEGIVGESFFTSSDINAVISYYGPTDLSPIAEETTIANWPGHPVRMLLGAAPKDDPDRARDASPYYRIRDDGPPVLLIHGEDDFIVYPNQSERFHEAYREASLESSLVVVADAGHYGGGRYFGRDGPRKQVLDFLRKHLCRQHLGREPSRR